ncbi:MAG TPA: quinoprotein relay system zinc metallohydrolase 2, partial [Gammaproteobacteria bacterium]|nr:quinoprotein relay system zinc metallohydrolase 2 [Gammaproteobacteria bacterium]
IRTVTDKPVCYVINTHVHFDHVLGNLAFKQDNPEYIGHASLADAIENNREFFLQEFSDDLGPDPDENSIIGPDRTVADMLELDLGDRQLLLTGYPPAHTHADLTVLDKKTGTLWTGDLLFRERIPALDGDLKGWLAVMEELKKIEVNRIVPGHGSPGETWSETMTAQENYLTTLLTQTREGIAEGLFMEKAIETIGEKEKKKWLLYEQHHKSNVSKAFTQLEWE